MSGPRSFPVAKWWKRLVLVTSVIFCAFIGGAVADQQKKNPFDRFGYSPGHYGQGDWGWKVVGKAEVIDGDTLRIKGVKIRLHGIDAFELGQICTTTDGVPWGCGIAAKVRLAEMIRSDDVTCFGAQDKPDRYGRMIAVCHVWRRVNLNAAIVRTGYALAYRSFSTNFVGSESIARRERNGAWAGSFTKPWVWRKQRSREN